MHRCCIVTLEALCTRFHSSLLHCCGGRNLTSWTDISDIWQIKAKLCFFFVCFVIYVNYVWTSMFHLTFYMMFCHLVCAIKSLIILIKKCVNHSCLKSNKWMYFFSAQAWKSQQCVALATVTNGERKKESAAISPSLHSQQTSLLLKLKLLLLLYFFCLRAPPPS